MSVCSLIVTYNRKNLLLRCVENCLKQNIMTDVFIYDNHSSDFTKEFLEQNGILSNPRVQYFYSETNVGGAGGFSLGMEMVYKKGYDYIFLMDDDGYPAADDCFMNCLEVYKKINKNEKCIVNAVVTTDDRMTLSFKTGNFNNLMEIKEKSHECVFYDSISPFNGTLISRTVIDTIGFPRKDFFIKGDETEYSCRAKKNKIRLVTAINAIYIHPAVTNYKKHFLFFSFDYGEESFWKEYYRTRNYVYIYKTYFGMIQLIKHIIFTMIKFCICKEDRKRKRIYLIKGLKDGFMNRFEKIDF